MPRTEQLAIEFPTFPISFLELIHVLCIHRVGEGKQTEGDCGSPSEDRMGRRLSRLKLTSSPPTPVF